MCIGTMDGKHVKIMPPPRTGTLFSNYKGDFSIPVLAVVSAYLRFVYINVGTNERIGDSRVQTKFKKGIDSDSLNIPRPDILLGINVEVPFVLVENDAFPLTHYIMKPFSGYRLGEKRENF